MQAERAIKNELERTTTNSAEKFLGNLAEKLGATIQAKTIFGEPVERNGVTVIAVAKARWGFGGGVGQRKDEDGGGGGGGAQLSPVGFIELKNGEATFRHIYTFSPSLIALGAVAGLLMVRRFLARGVS